MASRSIALIALLLAAFIIAPMVAVADEPSKPRRPSLLRMFSRQSPTQLRQIDGELTEDAGPFLILAATLVGEGSKDRAQQLAAEIRRDLELPTFIYNENFDFTKTVSFDPRTARRTKYANSYTYDAYAVLVGEYDTVAHPAIEGDLDRIKRTQSAVLDDQQTLAAETEGGTPVTTLKKISHSLLATVRSQGKNYGPMAHAFVTRNPMLPADYFTAPPVDSFVRELNEDTEHSLLRCKGKYTVIVKTFRGTNKILDSRSDEEFVGNQKNMNRMKRQAAKMVRELRKKNVEAYQYHDRERSLVCVGQFESLGQELPGGKFQYDQGIRNVMSRYSALNVRPELARQVPAGTQGIAANAVAMIPFDVQPTPIAIPKVSKRSLYGMRNR